MENDEIRQNFDNLTFIILFTKSVGFLNIFIDPNSKFNYVDQAYAKENMQSDRYTNTY